jgi:hypothetical protein
VHRKERNKQIIGYLPPCGWINIRRHVFRDSVPVPEGLTEQEQKIYRRRVTMGLGFFCSWKCLLAAMPRLGELNRQLNERGIGLRRLAPGEPPPPMPPRVQKGGPT